jgi:S-DNA-T family DNA segregation ATPase FtsK/SpoIIIE
MRTISNRLMDWLPDYLMGIARRRMIELGGLAVLAIAALAMAALATWVVGDPSWSHAADRSVRNLLGRPGAAFADLMVQLFGIASIALVLPVAIWGWWIMTHRVPARLRIRFLAYLIGIALAAGFAACLPLPPAWPLSAGLGGVAGDALLKLAANASGGLLDPFWLKITVGVLLAPAALAALAVAVGVGFPTKPKRARRPRVDLEEAIEEEEAESEPDDEEAVDSRWSIAASLGALTHGFLALRARLFRWRARPNAAHSAVREILGPEDGAMPRRREPGFSERTALSPEDEDGAEPRRARAPRAERRRLARPRRAGGYEFPSLELLAAPGRERAPTLSAAALTENARVLETVLDDFGVKGEIVNAHPGPVVTLYELEPAPGIKSSRVIGLADDIARSMSAIACRVAVVPGRNAIGIELPNPKREKVVLRELLASDEFSSSAYKLPLCLGKTIGGDPVIVDLARMPHLLIAGTTGSGKSVAINTMILSLVYRLKPEECRLILVDPKMLELSVYEGIPQLLTPVVTDPRKAVVALKWAVREMEDRYRAMSKLGVRNIDGFNARVGEAAARGERITRTVQTGFDRETGEAIYEKEELDLAPLPLIVVVVDEMADLMMVAGKDIEGAIQRLAQMARAAGIHLVMATQRPSVDVITGTIKANFPTRVSFQVTSKIDSRTILNEQGAEQLLGQGDMLYMAGGGRIVRVHGPFVSDQEVERVVRHLKTQGTPEYLEAVIAEEDENPDLGTVFDKGSFGDEGGGDLYGQAVQVVLRDRKASTSYIQRRLQIGYNRAASLIERMEKEGVVGAANHAGKREILVGERNEEAY